MSKFWTLWIFKIQTIPVLLAVFEKPCAPWPCSLCASFYKVCGNLGSPPHTHPGFFFKGEKKTRRVKSSLFVFPKCSEKVSLVLFLSQRTLGCPHRRNLMFEMQKHLVKLQQNNSFFPATFNSKKMKIWLCNAGRKLPSGILFFFPPFFSPQSRLAMLWGNGQEESEVGKEKSRTPGLM